MDIKLRRRGSDNLLKSGLYENFKKNDIFRDDDSLEELGNVISKFSEFFKDNFIELFLDRYLKEENEEFLDNLIEKGLLEPSHKAEVLKELEHKLIVPKSYISRKLRQKIINKKEF